MELQEMRARFMRGYSADVYDVLDKMGYPNQCMSLKIRPLHPDMKVCGAAFTIQGTSEPRFGEDFPNPDFDGFAQFRRFYDGCVIVMNAEREDCCGHWGEMMSYGAKRAGAVGAVIDGGTRDRAGILGVGDFPCFARYTSPIESKKRWRPKALEVPIFVEGTLTRQLRFNPGDIIFGDSDGVLCIPKEISEEVLIRTEEIIKNENLSREAFRAGDTIHQVFEKYNRA